MAGVCFLFPSFFLSYSCSLLYLFDLFPVLSFYSTVELYVLLLIY